MSYTHLSLEERHYIEVEKKLGRSLNKIAEALGRAQSTLSRELSRNTGQRGYRHKQADRLADERHTSKAKACKLTDELKDLIRGYLEEDWSPEPIAGRLENEGIIKLHHETIYQYVLADKQAGGELYKHLRHQNKSYRKRYGSAHNRTGIPNRVDMDERQSKLRLARPLPDKKARPVAEAIVALLAPIQAFVKTLTFDNGKEFAAHAVIAQALGCDTYFTKPYHSWERGQNENANGLLRQYFPKAMALIDVTTQAVFRAVHKLNSRPRKCLGFKTPYEAFKQATRIDVENLMGYALMT